MNRAGIGHFVAVAAAVLLAACASYSGRGLQPGVSGLDEVLAVMGQPAMQWREPDGSLQLSYPRGPAGYHSFMVRIAPDGRLREVENVMDMKAFARIQPGMDEAAVLRTLGPPVPAWTVYFKARRERVWEWRYCDDWNNAARFDVLFDGDSRRVRSTLSWRETCLNGPCFCGH